MGNDHFRYEALRKVRKKAETNRCPAVGVRAAKLGPMNVFITTLDTRQALGTIQDINMCTAIGIPSPILDGIGDRSFIHNNTVVEAWFQCLLVTCTWHRHTKRLHMDR